MIPVPEQTRSVWLAEQTYPQLKQFLSESDAVVVPVGSLEVHGRHLPVGCDTYCAMATGVLAARQEKLLIAPPLFITFCGSTRGLRGTVTVTIRCETDYLMGYCRGLLEAGFQRIVLVSWHAPAYSAVEVARTLFEERLAPVALYNASDAFSAEVLAKVFGPKADGHYAEASALAAAFEILGMPQLVDFAASATDEEEAPGPPGLDEARANKALVGYFVTDVTQHVPTRAGISPELGRKMIQHTANRVAGILHGLADYRDWLAQAENDGTLPPRE
jgi:creatinine amidohydrolase/Fe(II)-dependent formamide hydrolase-like protein